MFNQFIFLTIVLILNCYNSLNSMKYLNSNLGKIGQFSFPKKTANGKECHNEYQLLLPFLSTMKFSSYYIEQNQYDNLKETVNDKFVSRLSFNRNGLIKTDTQPHNVEGQTRYTSSTSNDAATLNGNI